MVNASRLPLKKIKQNVFIKELPRGLAGRTRARQILLLTIRSIRERREAPLYMFSGAFFLANSYRQI